MEQVIETCVIRKRDIVETDEFDRGQRQLLNLGHTVGHAIELCSDMAVSHGSAVAIGMVIVMRASVRMGLCTSADLDELIALLEANALPTACPYTAAELARVATADKKRSGDRITLVLPYAIGDSRLYPIPVPELESFIEMGLSV